MGDKDQAGKPGAELKLLDAFVGVWKTEGTMIENGDNWQPWMNMKFTRIK